KEVFPNTLVLITERMPNLRSVALGVWLKKGSRHESEKENGISHFIEHLLFKGTETRTAKEIALIIDSVGGQMDAFTTKEYTCFYFKVLDEHLDIAVDLLSEIVRRPKFVPEEIEKERKVIYEEIKMVDDTADELIYDLFSASFYRDHPLGRPIQGTIESVSRMQPEQLIRFFRDSYQPSNLLITAAGNLRHERLAAALRQAFEPLTNGSGQPLGRPPGSHADIVVREKKELGQLHLCLGVPGLPLPDDRRYPEHVLNTLLGGTMSSRLFQHIREERGLAYSVFSSVNSFLDTGNLMVYAATSPESGREVVDLILQELRRLKEDPVGPAELQMAKDHLKGSLMLSLESSSSRMSNLARQEVYFGRQFTLNEILEGIDRVSAPDLKSLAEDLFDPKGCTLAVLGKTEGLRLDRVELTF
ncbi:MAG TPA: pitrilysin family protein, partial [Candidatus Polarisedimenticolia bacterium]|nr:pitrilysin family protein [Candidatus Polarisedimenticolia bacterium]